MLIKRVEERDGQFVIHRPARPTFDDYIEDLSILFETYPTEGDQQLHEVRKAMALIDDLEAVADKLPKLPRDKREVANDEQ